MTRLYCFIADALSRFPVCLRRICYVTMLCGSFAQSPLGASGEVPDQLPSQDLRETLATRVIALTLKKGITPPQRLENEAESTWLYRSGIFLEDSTVGELDLSAAREMLAHAAEMGSSAAYARLALYARYGIGEPKDECRCGIRFLKALNLGYLEAYRLLATTPNLSDFVRFLPDTASKRMLEDIKMGRPEALFAGTRILTEKKYDRQRLLRLLEKCDEAGVSLAILELTKLHLAGEYMSLTDRQKLVIDILSKVDDTHYGDLRVEGSDGPVVAEELVSILTEAEYWGNTDAALLLCRLALSKYSLPGGLRAATIHYRWARRFGGSEAQFYGAAIKSIGGDDHEAAALFGLPSDQLMWRARFAAELHSTLGLSIKVSVVQAARGCYTDYAALVAERQSTKDGKPAIPLAMDGEDALAAMCSMFPGNSGPAKIVFWVPANGEPTAIDVANCESTELLKAIKSRVAGWRFRPATKGGKIVPSMVEIPLFLKSVSEPVQKSGNGSQ